MIKHILFDLDGTLLPMDQSVFIKGYFGALTMWGDVFLPVLAALWLTIAVGLILTERRKTYARSQRPGNG